MGAAEKIQAAIEKLDRLRDAALSAPWTRTDELWAGAGRYDIESPAALVTSDGDGIGSIGNIAEADLIVTLHRTIDAQLAILRRGKVLAAKWPEADWTITVDLADAILGDLA